MYFGTYEHTLDDKGRLLIPRKIKENLGSESSLYIMQGFEGSIAVYDKDAFEKLTKDVNSLNFYKKNSRDYLRIALSSVYELTIDKVGRIQIPTQVLNKFKISKEVTIIGVNDHFEIWDKEAFVTYQNEASERFSEIAESLEKEHE